METQSPHCMATWTLKGWKNKTELLLNTGLKNCWMLLEDTVLSLTGYLPTVQASVACREEERLAFVGGI